MLSVPLLNNFPSPQDISVSVPAWTHCKPWIHPKYLKDQFAVNEIVLVIGNTVTLRNSAVGTGEISQWLSAHIAFAEDPSSVPRLCTVACNSSSRGFSSLFSEALHSHAKNPAQKKRKSCKKKKKNVYEKHCGSLSSHIFKDVLIPAVVLTCRTIWRFQRKGKCWGPSKRSASWDPETMRKKRWKPSWEEEGEHNCRSWGLSHVEPQQHPCLGPSAVSSAQHKMMS